MSKKTFLISLVFLQQSCIATQVFRALRAVCGQPVKSVLFETITDRRASLIQSALTSSIQDKDVLKAVRSGKIFQKPIQELKPELSSHLTSMNLSDLQHNTNKLKAVLSILNRSIKSDMDSLHSLNTRDSVNQSVTLKTMTFGAVRALRSFIIKHVLDKKIKRHEVVSYIYSELRATFLARVRDIKPPVASGLYVIDCEDPLLSKSALAVNNQVLLKYLLDCFYVAKVDKTSLLTMALDTMISSNDVSEKRIAQEQAELLIPYMSSQQLLEGQNSLIEQAIRSGSLAVVNKMLDRGVSLNAFITSEFERCTVLDGARRWGSTELVEGLLKPVSSLSLVDKKQQ